MKRMEAPLRRMLSALIRRRRPSGSLEAASGDPDLVRSLAPGDVRLRRHANLIEVVERQVSYAPS